jgi:orotate phosphoribosyltransferase
VGPRAAAQAALRELTSPAARDALVAELREHALVIGDVTLTSGRKAQYLIDAKRAILRPLGFRALGELVAEEARALEVTAVGGITMGADPIACAALAGGADVKAFFVRKERKEHGLARWIEGPPLEPGERCLVVEDVVTTGGSTIKAIDRVRDEGHEVAGVLAILDRLAGGAGAIREALGPGGRYTALTTIDDVYPERPDR